MSPLVYYSDRFNAHVQTRQRLPCLRTVASPLLARSSTRGTVNEYLETRDARRVKPVSKPLPIGLSSSADLTEDEARKYMDLIHSLLKDGQSPDVLVERGANPKYVTAVCEEIVQGTRRRKEVSIEAKPNLSTTLSPRPALSSHVTSLLEGTAENPTSSSPSSDDVEVIVSTDRRMSMSSEGSAEFQLIEQPSPPRPRVTRIMPSSSWAPTPAPAPLVQSSVPAPPVQSSVPAPPTQSIKVDTYTPSQPAQSSGRSTPIVDSFVPTPTPVQSWSAAPAPPPIAEPLPPPPSLPERPTFPNNATAGPSRLPTDIPTGPRNPGAKRPKRNKKKRFEDEADAEVQVLNYDEEVQPAVDELKQPKATSTPVAIDSSKPTPAPVFNPIAAFNQTPVPHFLPTPATVSLLRSGATFPAQQAPHIPTAPPNAAQLEIKAKNDMLEIRRRALASMKLRKAKRTSPEKPAAELPALDPPTSASVKTIEQEVLDLEQEVIGLQALADLTPDEGSPMELDSPESGQGTPAILPLTLASTIPSTTSLAIPPVVPIASSLPARRGIKRPNAEDMMESLPSSSAPSWIKRRPFGGLPQRPGRLLINLDDHSDSESDDGDAGMSTPPIVIKNVMVEDKEAQIRALRAKIAAIQAKKKAAAAATESSAASTGVTGSPASDSPGLTPAAMHTGTADAAARKAPGPVIYARLTIVAKSAANDEDVVMSPEAADVAVNNAELAIAAAEISIATEDLSGACQTSRERSSSHLSLHCPRHPGRALGS